MSKLVLIAMMVLAGLMVIGMLSSRGNGSLPPAPPAPTARSTAEPSRRSKAQPDDGKQNERRAFIQRLIDDHRIFIRTGYDGGTLPSVWIEDAFLKLDLKSQNQFLSVVYAYYSIENDDFGIVEGNPLFRDPLIIKIDDGTPNGKRVGRYDPIDGVSFN